MNAAITKYGANILGCFDSNWNPIHINDVDMDDIIVVKDTHLCEVTAYDWMGDNELVSLCLVYGETEDQSIARVRKAVQKNDQDRIEAIAKQ